MFKIQVHKMLVASQVHTKPETQMFKLCCMLLATQMPEMSNTRLLLQNKLCAMEMLFGKTQWDKWKAGWLTMLISMVV
jgi:hypothetical protein